MVMIQCFDKKDYLLEQWKIFESIPLHMFCLKNYPYFQSVDAAIKLPSTTNISYEKMDLFSKALDNIFLSIKLGVAPEEFFKKCFFEKLKPERQRLLIITAGRFDEKCIKQLNSPIITSCLVDACFEKDLLNNHIKSLLQKDEMEEYYSSKIINYNVSKLCSQSISSHAPYVIHSNERGYINKVPSCLAVKGAVSKNQVGYFIDQKCVDNVLRRVFYAKKVEDWHYYVTNVDCQQEKLGNEVVLWSINSSNKKITHTMIKFSNSSSVVEFNDLPTRGAFTKNGTYFVLYSVNGVFVTEILRQKDGTSIFNTYQICHDAVNITDVQFYNDETQLIVSYFDDIKEVQGKLHLFKITGECIKTIVVDGLPYQSVENGKKLLVFSALETESGAENFCVFTNNNIEKSAEISYTKLPFNSSDGFPDCFICSPDKNFCAILAGDNIISLIAARGGEPLVYNLRNAFSLISKKNHKMLFSSDSKYLIVLGFYKGKFKCHVSKYIIDVWSTITGKKRSSVIIPGHIIDLMFCNGWSRLSFGLTPKNQDLVLYAENCNQMYKVPFFSQEDQNDVHFLVNDASVTVLIILRRLYLENKNGNKISLYEEEPAYKILQALNKPDFIKKYLYFNVINNNKNMILSIYEKGFASIQKLWK